MIIIVLAAVILGIVLLVMKLNFLTVATYFKKGSIIVYGHKGKGKDLLFQGVIKQRKRPYYSNLFYGGRHHELDPSALTIAPNTFNTFISNEGIIKIKPVFEEKQDVYLSDAGIYFPSQYYTILDKRYPSMPLYFALSRHLYLQNIHLNTQALTRVWDKLREQADFYIHCRSCFVLFKKFVFQQITLYDRYQDAVDDVRPFRPVAKKRSEEVRAAEAQAMQRHGLIKNLSVFYVLPRKSQRYDTRAFKQMILQNED